MLKKIFDNVLLFLTLGLILLANPVSAADFSHSTDNVPAMPAVKDGVISKLKIGSSLRVIIQLKEGSDAGPAHDHATSGRKKSRISRHRIKILQDKVISSFAAPVFKGDFVVGRRLKNAPVIAARINRRALRALNRHKNVARVVEDKKVHALLAESGPLIGSTTAHAAGFSGSGVAVAVIDTGIDTDHPFLQDNILWEECFLADGGCPITGGDRASGPGSAEDDASHGTHVSGIITSSDPDHQGIAPDTAIVALKALDAQGEGYFSDILAAVDWVVNHKDDYGIKVINLSLGSEETYAGVCDETEAIAADMAAAAKAAGITVVAAAGNDALDGQMSMPACLSSVISVGAVYDSDVGSMFWSGSCQDVVTQADMVVCFSNASPCLDLLAPGSVIISTTNDGGVCEKSGTSMACPHAAAAAALLYALDPGITPNEVADVLKTTGEDVLDERNGLVFPRLEVDTALDLQLSLMHPDSDGDGFSDEEEIAVGSDPSNENIPAAYPGLYGDLDEDGDVDGKDLSHFIYAYNSVLGDGSYTVFLDVNNDGSIDDYDNNLFASFYSHLVVDSRYDSAVDFDSDGDVDHLDLFIFLKSFHTAVGDPDYNVDADVTKNGVVDEADLKIVCDAFMSVQQ